jgi:hypothetical protein
MTLGRSEMVVFLRDLREPGKARRAEKAIGPRLVAG